MGELAVMIPCKAPTLGKSRLAEFLGDDKRRQLCRSFLLRTLDVAREIVPPGRIILVSGDPEVAAIGRSCGARIVEDSGAGLNQALEIGRASLLRDDRPDRLVVVPIDLPHVTPENLLSLSLCGADIVLVPDHDRRGTNVLALRGPAIEAMPFSYGPDSFAAHRASAERSGYRWQVVEDAALSFDVDEPKHYLAWMKGQSVVRAA